MPEIDGDEYGELQRCWETDAMFRVREDGDFILLYDAQGKEIHTGLRREDIECIADAIGLIG